MGFHQSLETKRCRQEDSLKRRQEAKVAGRKKTPDEDGSDEDRTDESQQVLPLHKSEGQYLFAAELLLFIWLETAEGPFLHW